MFDGRPFDAPSVAEEETTLGLVRRMRAGDRGAAESLFRLHHERLQVALRLRLAGEARFLVEREELVQETFTKALVGLDAFEWRGQGAFLAWLLGIATHTLLDLARRRDAAPWAPERDSTLEALAGAALDTGTPSAAAARNEELVELEHALARLDEDEREAVVRRKLLGQDYASLACDLGLTEGAARMRVSRAMSTLSRWAQERA